MLYQLTLPGIPSATFLPELACGPTLCAKPDGQTAEPCGQVLALASLSARQAKEQGLLTSGTCGPRSSTSLASVSLARFLANKLAQKTDLLGSTLFTLTWKEQVTPAGRVIPLLRASVPRTSGKGYISALPTPTRRDYRGHASLDFINKRKKHPRGVNLAEYMQRSLGARGYLNPDLVRLLMGLPPEWCDCAVMAMQLLPRKRKRSFKQ